MRSASACMSSTPPPGTRRRRPPSRRAPPAASRSPGTPAPAAAGAGRCPSMREARGRDPSRRGRAASRRRRSEGPTAPRCVCALAEDEVEEDVLGEALLRAEPTRRLREPGAETAVVPRRVEEVELHVDDEIVPDRARSTPRPDRSSCSSTIVGRVDRRSARRTCHRAPGHLDCALLARCTPTAPRARPPTLPPTAAGPDARRHGRAPADRSPPGPAGQPRHDGRKRDRLVLVLERCRRSSGRIRQFSRIIAALDLGRLRS